MRFITVIGLLAFSIASRTQTMTVISTLTDGQRDTLRFGFFQNATLAEDNSLGELNIFMTPVDGYEGRVLQRDSGNFSCAMQLNGQRIYYPENFDSKINYRNPEDTSLQNRLFELWYSDNQTDSVEMICDIPLRSFLSGAHQYIADCLGDPPSPVGILIIQDDTIKHVRFAVHPGLGIKQFIFITNPDITITSQDEIPHTDNQININVYPNPTSGSFFVQPPNTEEISRIFIYDSIGKLMEQFDSTSYDSGIDLSFYSSGLYMVLFELRNGKYILKMLLKQ